MVTITVILHRLIICQKQINDSSCAVLPHAVDIIEFM